VQAQVDSHQIRTSPTTGGEVKQVAFAGKTGEGQKRMI